MINMFLINHNISVSWVTLRKIYMWVSLNFRKLSWKKNYCRKKIKVWIRAETEDRLERRGTHVSHLS